MAVGGIKATPKEVAEALRGHYREQHVFALSQALKTFDFLRDLGGLTFNGEDAIQVVVRLAHVEQLGVVGNVRLEAIEHQHHAF